MKLRFHPPHPYTSSVQHRYRLEVPPRSGVQASKGRKSNASVCYHPPRTDALRRRGLTYARVGFLWSKLQRNQVGAGFSSERGLKIYALTLHGELDLWVELEWCGCAFVYYLMFVFRSLVFGFRYICIFSHVSPLHYYLHYPVLNRVRLFHN